MTAVADRFVDLACLTYRPDESRARRVEAAALLVATPGLALASVHAAAAAGDPAALRAHLDRDPAGVERPGSPRGWPPLLALCYSRVAQADARACLELLLARGADPGAHVLLDGCRFTALTGVIGEGEAGPFEQPPHPDARALAELLLDAGADPVESQGLYNTHFRASDGWLELLLARGLGPGEDLDYLLGQAAVRGLVARARLLLDHGAAANGRDHYRGRPHLVNALREGHAELARLLIDRGATLPVLDEQDRFQIAVLAGDAPEARRLLAATPSLAGGEPLFAAARHGHQVALELGLELGLPLDAVDHAGVTALHHAARQGHLDSVRLLLARGAARTVRDHVYGGTPAGHARHFSERWARPDGAAIIALLEQPDA